MVSQEVQVRWVLDLQVELQAGRVQRHGRVRLEPANDLVVRLDQLVVVGGADGLVDEQDVVAVGVAGLAEGVLDEVGAGLLAGAAGSDLAGGAIVDVPLEGDPLPVQQGVCPPVRVLDPARHLVDDVPHQDRVLAGRVLNAVVGVLHHLSDKRPRQVPDAGPGGGDRASLPIPDPGGGSVQQHVEAGLHATLDHQLVDHKVEPKFVVVVDVAVAVFGRCAEQLVHACPLHGGERVGGAGDEVGDGLGAGVEVVTLFLLVPAETELDVVPRRFLGEVDLGIGEGVCVADEQGGGAGGGSGEAAGGLVKQRHR